MAHECPQCGLACDCDGDDTWMDVQDPGDCAHACDPDDEDFDDIDG